MALNVVFGKDERSINSFSQLSTHTRLEIEVVSHIIETPDAIESTSVFSHSNWIFSN